MRINLNGPDASAGVDALAQKQAPASGASGAGGASAANDTAQLSSDQAGIQDLVAQLNELPEVRQEKVASLSRAIDQGTYQVTPEQTAEALISELQVRSAA